MDLTTHPDGSGSGSGGGFGSDRNLVPCDEDDDRLYQRTLLDIHPPSPGTAVAIAPTPTSMQLIAAASHQDTQMIFSSEAEIIAALQHASTRYVVGAATNPNSLVLISCP